METNPGKLEKIFNSFILSGLLMPALLYVLAFFSCVESQKKYREETITHTEIPEYFNLRPEQEKNDGYSAAVRIGKNIKIDVVSQDDEGRPLGENDMREQMKNCYADVGEVLDHYGYSFDDIVIENIYTTNMTELNKLTKYHNTFYNKNFPAGVWIEVKGLASPKYLIEIQIEAYNSKK